MIGRHIGCCISAGGTGYIDCVKHLVDLDEPALEAARRHLGTRTLKDTVNAALRLAAGGDDHGRDVDAALNTLAALDFGDRADAWR